MVHLTFIPQMEINVPKAELLTNIRQFYHLAEKIKLEYGKPDAIYTANNEVCISTAKVLNLVFGVHGIHATEALDEHSSNAFLNQFFDNLIEKAKAQHLTHIVIVVSEIQYSAEIGLSICQISSADSWLHNPDAYQERFITKNEVINDEVSVDIVDVFLDTIRTIPLV